MIVTELTQIGRKERESWLGKDYAIDVETEGLTFHSHALVGVALFVNNKSYYFVLKHTNDSQDVVDYLSLNDLRMLLAPILSQHDVTAALHNAKFDRHFFERFGLSIQSRWFDTLLAAQLLDENRRNGLKDLTPLVDPTIEHVKYADLAVYDKYPRTHPFAVPLKAFADYAEKDVIVTYKLYKKFQPEMAKDAFRGVTVQDVFNTIWMPMIPTLQQMESFGFKVDQKLASDLYVKYTAIAATNEEVVQRAGYEMLAKKPVDEIRGLYWKIIPEEEEELIFENDRGEKRMMILGISTPVSQPTPRSKMRKLHFNTGSSDQLIDLILGEGVKELLPDDVFLITTKTGEDSVNVENLKVIQYYLQDKTPYYIQALLDWRKASKFVSTYLDAFLTKTDERARLHCFFSMAANDAGRGGTRTGRLSSSNINLQNIPSRDAIGLEARSCFIAGEGNSLIVADYSNMETVIFAHYSQDPVLLKAFSEGLDVHALTACGQHDLDYDHFVAELENGNKEYKKMRATAKTLLFGQAYGMGAAKLQRTLLTQNGQEYTLEEAKRMLEAFNDTYIVMSDWKKEVIEFAGRHGFVPTILGRKRRLPLVFSNDRTVRGRAQRQGVNAVIQGSCADILFQAMVPIQAAFKAMGGSLVASVHDELIGELPDQFAEAGAQVMSHLMVDLINPRLRCKLRAEAGIGKTWGDAKG